MAKLRLFLEDRILDVQPGKIQSLVQSGELPSGGSAKGQFLKDGEPEGSVYSIRFQEKRTGLGFIVKGKYTGVMDGIGWDLRSFLKTSPYLENGEFVRLVFTEYDSATGAFLAYERRQTIEVRK